MSLGQLDSLLVVVGMMSRKKTREYDDMMISKS
jgi:hypothetical protein